MKVKDKMSDIVENELNKEQKIGELSNNNNNQDGGEDINKNNSNLSIKNNGSDYASKELSERQKELMEKLNHAKNAFKLPERITKTIESGSLFAEGVRGIFSSLFSIGSIALPVAMTFFGLNSEKKVELNSLLLQALQYVHGHKSTYSTMEGLTEALDRIDGITKDIKIELSDRDIILAMKYVSTFTGLVAEEKKEKIYSKDDILEYIKEYNEKHGVTIDTMEPNRYSGYMSSKKVTDNTPCLMHRNDAFATLEDINGILNIKKPEDVVKFGKLVFGIYVGGKRIELNQFTSGVIDKKISNTVDLDCKIKDEIMDRIANKSEDLPPVVVDKLNMVYQVIGCNEKVKRDSKHSKILETLTSKISLVEVITPMGFDQFVSSRIKDKNKVDQLDKDIAKNLFFSKLRKSKNIKVDIEERKKEILGLKDVSEEDKIKQVLSLNSYEDYIKYLNKIDTYNSQVEAFKNILTMDVDELVKLYLNPQSIQDYIMIGYEMQFLKNSVEIEDGVTYPNALLQFTKYLSNVMAGSRYLKFVNEISNLSLLEYINYDHVDLPTAVALFRLRSVYVETFFSQLAQLSLIIEEESLIVANYAQLVNTLSDYDIKNCSKNKLSYLYEHREFYDSEVEDESQNNFKFINNNKDKIKCKDGDKARIGDKSFIKSCVEQKRVITLRLEGWVAMAGTDVPAYNTSFNRPTYNYFEKDLYLKDISESIDTTYSSLFTSIVRLNTTDYKGDTILHIARWLGSKNMLKGSELQIGLKAALYKTRSYDFVYDGQSMVVNNAYGNNNTNTNNHILFPNRYPLGSNELTTVAINSRAVDIHTFAAGIKDGGTSWDADWQPSTFGRSTTVVFIREDEASELYLNSYWTLCHLPYPFMICDRRKDLHSIIGDVVLGAQNICINNLSLIKIQEQSSGNKVLYVIDGKMASNVQATDILVGVHTLNTWTNRPNGGVNVDIAASLQATAVDERLLPDTWRYYMDKCFEKYYKKYAVYGDMAYITEFVTENCLKYTNVTSGYESTGRTNNDIHQLTEKNNLDSAYGQIYTQAAYSFAQAAGAVYNLTTCSGVVAALVLNIRNNSVTHFDCAHFNNVKYVLKSVSAIVEESINRVDQPNLVWDGINFLVNTHELSYLKAAFVDEKCYRAHLPYTHFVIPDWHLEYLEANKHFATQKRKMYNLLSASTFWLTGGDIHGNSHYTNLYLRAIYDYDYAPVNFLSVKRTNEYYIMKRYTILGITVEPDKNSLFQGFPALARQFKSLPQLTASGQDWRVLCTSLNNLSKISFDGLGREKDLKFDNFIKYMQYIWQFINRLEYSSLVRLASYLRLGYNESNAFSTPILMCTLDFHDEVFSRNRNIHGDLTGNRNHVTAAVYPQKVAFPFIRTRETNSFWSIWISKTNIYQIFESQIELLRYKPFEHALSIEDKDESKKDISSLNLVMNDEIDFLTF